MEEYEIEETEDDYNRELEQRIYDKHGIRIEIYTGCCDEVKDYCAERGVKAW